MAIVMTLNHSQITDISGYNYLGQLAYGENGDYFGPMEVSAGTPDDITGVHAMWDSNPDDGVNSGWVPVAFSFQQGSSGLSLDTGDSDATTAAVGSFTKINHVDIRAGVTGQTAMLWSNVLISFYKGGVLTEQVSAGSLGVDKTTVPGGAAAEQIMSVTPTNSNNDKVVISGSVKLAAPQGVYPGETDIFSQVLIYTA